MSLLDPLGAGSDAAAPVGDTAWLGALLDVEAAFTEALVDAGAAPDEARSVADAVRSAPIDLHEVAEAARSGGNPVIALVRLLGPIAEAAMPKGADFVHVGATSQDVMDTAAMLVASRAASELDASLGRTADLLATLAGEHVATPMVGRTLGQHAAPTTFGLLVAGRLDAIVTARAGLRDAIARAPLQWWGAVGTGAALAAWAGARTGDGRAVAHAARQAAAERLGLIVPVVAWHTGRAPIVEVADAFAAVTETIGAMAAQLGSLARSEIGEVTESLEAGQGGSSAMPHKHNPVTVTLLAAAARRVPGLLVGVHSGMSAEDQRPMGAWHAEWEPLRALFRIALQAASEAAALVPRLEVHEQRMQKNLVAAGTGVMSEQLSAVLAADLGKRAAFSLVADAADRAAEHGRSLGDEADALLAERGSPTAVREKARGAVGLGDVVEAAAEIVSAVVARHRSFPSMRRPASAIAQGGHR